MNLQDELIYIGIGSNLGDRFLNIASAINLLKNHLKILQYSSILEYPALIKSSSKYDDENLSPYLNIVIEVIFMDTCPNLMAIIHKIESQFIKKTENQKDFAAREIDIDILYFKGLQIKTKEIQVPHYDLLNRSFFLDLLSEINPFLEINKRASIELAREQKNKNLKLFAILNITTDSFSDGGSYYQGDNLDEQKIINFIQNCIKNNVNYIDIGAESTNPNAIEILQTEEISRLKHALKIVEDIYRENDRNLLPKISIDTHRYETMKELIDDNLKFDVINDVSGFIDERKLDLFKNTKHKIIFMHSLSVPASKKIVFQSDMEILISEIEEFLIDRLNFFKKHGINFNRLIFDPGIGFGKVSNQNIYILQNIHIFQKYNIPIMIGHSRKSFLSIFTREEFKNRDVESLAISLFLQKMSIEYLRVHNVEYHKRAILPYLSLFS